MDPPATAPLSAWTTCRARRSSPARRARPTLPPATPCRHPRRHRREGRSPTGRPRASCPPGRQAPGPPPTGLRRWRSPSSESRTGASSRPAGPRPATGRSATHRGRRTLTPRVQPWRSRLPTSARRRTSGPRLRSIARAMASIPSIGSGGSPATSTRSRRAGAHDQGDRPLELRKRCVDGGRRLGRAPDRACGAVRCRLAARDARRRGPVRAGRGVCARRGWKARIRLAGFTRGRHRPRPAPPRRSRRRLGARDGTAPKPPRRRARSTASDALVACRSSHSRRARSHSIPVPRRSHRPGADCRTRRASLPAPDPWRSGPRRAAECSGLEPWPPPGPRPRRRGSEGRCDDVRRLAGAEPCLQDVERDAVQTVVVDVIPAAAHSSSHRSNSPHPDRVIDHPRQYHAAGRVARGKPDDDGDQRDDRERADKQFHRKSDTPTPSGP